MLWMLGGLPVFLPSGQLSGSLCRTQVLIIRDFTTTCNMVYGLLNKVNLQPKAELHDIYNLVKNNTA